MWVGGQKLIFINLSDYLTEGVTKIMCKPNQSDI